MKILIALNSAWNLLNFREGLIRAFVADGHTVVLAAPSDDNVPALELLGARFVHLPMSTHSTNPLKDFALLLRMFQILRRERPDVLLCYTSKPNVYGSLAAQALNIPVFNNIAGLGSVFIRGGWLASLLLQLYRLALFSSQKVFFQNPDDLQMFLSLGLVVKSQTVLLPGSGVNLLKFQQMPLPYLKSKEFKQSECSKRFVFLMVARMLKDKGVEEYVQAARLLKSKHLQVECALLGFIDADNPNAIKAKQIQDWVDEGVVGYWGTSKDVREQLLLADCVVLPSYREGTPRSLLEAAAMGRPLITTDVPGCREVVHHGVNGLLCQPSDANDLAKQMISLLSMTDKKIQEMGNASRQLMELNFGEQRVIEQYSKALNELI